MEKVSAIIIALLPIITMAQVRVAMPTQPTSMIEYRYDSTENVMKLAQFYVGQDLFVIPAASSYKLKHNLDGYFGRGIKVVNASTWLDENVSYDDVQGRTYHVTGFEENKIRGQNNGFFFVLEDKETGEKLFYKNLTQVIRFFPFVTIGFKEKYERNNMGKKFVFRSYTLNNFESGEKIDAHKTTWTFKEIIAMPDVMKAGFYLENDEGVAVAVENMDDFIPKSDIDSYAKKYGKAMVDEALDGKVKVGMHSDLVRIAKGKPERINSANYGQQWVYKNGYIYIENEKVTGWN